MRVRLSDGSLVSPKYQHIKIYRTRKEIEDPTLIYHQMLQKLNNDPNIPDSEIRRFMVLYEQMMRKNPDKESIEDYFRIWGCLNTLKDQKPFEDKRIK